MTSPTTSPTTSTTTSTAGSADLQQRYAASLMNTFGPPKLVLTRGEGPYVWDAEGNRYLDLLGGIAVNALGHAHPALVEAVTHQLGTLGHVSNFFATEPQVRLAEKLLSLLGLEPGGGKVFFTNSGTEANEAAFKLTRRTGRTHLVAMEGSFHGRTTGALALTSKAAYREPFEPLPGHVTFVPYGDADALAAAVTDETAAVVLEPIQGEAGVLSPPADFLARAREITTAHGALLWLDEVQTGMGRTGSWMAHAESGVTPDVVTLAKGLAGGIPIGAMVAVGEQRHAARPRQPRHDVRRQPGRRGRRARGDRHDREGRPARQRHQGRRAAARRPGRPAGHRGPRPRAADRARPRRRGLGPGRRRGDAARRDPQPLHAAADPARAAAGAHRRAGRGVPRPVADDPRRGLRRRAEARGGSS